MRFGPAQERFQSEQGPMQLDAIQLVMEIQIGSAQPVSARPKAPIEKVCQFSLALSPSLSLSLCFSVFGVCVDACQFGQGGDTPVKRLERARKVNKEKTETETKTGIERSIQHNTKTKKRDRETSTEQEEK